MPVSSSSPARALDADAKRALERDGPTAVTCDQCGNSDSKTWDANKHGGYCSACKPRSEGLPVTFPSFADLYKLAPVSAFPVLDSSLTGIAYHEAGHAVMAQLFGIGQAGAQAAPGSGKVFLKSRSATDAELEVSDEELVIAAIRIAAMYFAGAAAQMLQQGIDVDGVLISSCSDWKFAGQILDEGGVGGSATGRLAYCQRFARAFLWQHWCEVTAVAEALEQRGTLTAEQVASLCAGRPLSCNA